MFCNVANRFVNPVDNRTSADQLVKVSFFFKKYRG